MTLCYIIHMSGNVTGNGIGMIIYISASIYESPELGVWFLFIENVEQQRKGEVKKL
ncbi:MAG: hypothetical protein HDR01_07140 [Lachnospiraceae bacterium]|nr:hypothetical protein [Lachnospiraceae bacterium]